ncbi:hypothetical protein THAOC_35627 [Thalassiosira oceanica]|uniref:N-acetyltransferase domain-containing protein n=1 Tax=Thalassiosira oceanica TaxID=159749 RepID=K0R1F6_THAOC|nr:hypothetical protein THAOC_35627 [Thalassiosira oceanica]|eukprot:EJK45745.1 hypothetical protein THAOC_35627 [Thalassiosira oceanica]
MASTTMNVPVALRIPSFLLLLIGLAPTVSFAPPRRAASAPSLRPAHQDHRFGWNRLYNPSGAKFIVDNFWLSSPQQLLLGDQSAADIPDSSYMSLRNVQFSDLQEKYGERLTQRKLDALMIAALDEEDELAGMVTLEVVVMDTQTKELMSASTSEFRITQSVASLGPKQRREFKNAHVIDIANELLPPTQTAVVTLSNLCVSPTSRRKGIAAQLCGEAERITRESLGYSALHLRVESSNEAAKRLYEKLGYDVVFESVAPVLRVDANAGGFIEIDSETTIMKKELS